MSQDPYESPKAGKSGRRREHVLLQPLSEEFLYRSPVEPAAHTCRRCAAPQGGNDHVAE